VIYTARLSNNPNAWRVVELQVERVDDFDGRLANIWKQYRIQPWSVFRI